MSLEQKIAWGGLAWPAALGLLMWGLEHEGFVFPPIVINGAIVLGGVGLIVFTALWLHIGCIWARSKGLNLGPPIIIATGLVIVLGSGVWGAWMWPRGSQKIVTTDHPSQREATIPLLPPANLIVPTREPLPPTISKSSSERIIVSETPSYLLRMYSNHTSLEADKLTAPYIGKWMRLSGVLRDVQSPTPAGIAVKFISIEKYQAFIDTWFDDKWLDKLSVLRAGTKIVALCQIQEIQPKSMTFQHCEIDVAH